MESTSLITSYNLNETCRTCLKNEDGLIMIPIFETKNTSIQIIDELTVLKLKIVHNDGLPQQMCNGCFNDLINVNTFRMVCERSQDILKKYCKTTTLFLSESIDNSKISLKNEISSDSTQKAFEFVNIENDEFNRGDDTEDNTSVEYNDYINDNCVVIYNDLINEDIDNNSNNGDAEELIRIDNANNKKDTKNKLMKNFKNKCNKNNNSINNNNNETTTNKGSNSKRKRHYKLSCKYCGKNIRNIENLKLHENERKCIDENKPWCHICKTSFKNINMLDEHLNTVHPKDRPHACTICGKRFQSSSNLTAHKETHNKENSYHCGICSKASKTKWDLLQHIKRIHTISEHICPYCSLKFETDFKFKYHLKSHNPDKQHKCTYCDKSFLQPHHLTVHERTHTGLRPHLCNICGKGFKSEGAFIGHVRIHTGVRPYVCTVCGKDFAHRRSYVLHSRQHTGIRPYQCEICDKNFIQKSSLTIHIRTHTGERPYKCDTCDKSFIQTQKLKYHRYSAHGGPRPPMSRKKITKSLVNVNNSNDNNKIIANVCNINEPTSMVATAFTSIESLPLSLSSSSSSASASASSINIKTTEHTNCIIPIGTQPIIEPIFPYYCTICNKGFKLQTKLSSHTRVHSKERKHICATCGNSFKRAEHLRIHVNGVHLKQKPYTCKECGKSFTQPGYRNIHLRRCHITAGKSTIKEDIY